MDPGKTREQTGKRNGSETGHEVCLEKAMPLAGDQVPSPSTKIPNGIISPVSSARTAEAEWEQCCKASINPDSEVQPSNVLLPPSQTAPDGHFDVPL